MRCGKSLWGFPASKIVINDRIDMQIFIKYTSCSTRISKVTDVVSERKVLPYLIVGYSVIR